MNKILVNKNKIVDYQDDFIKIVDGNYFAGWYRAGYLWLWEQ